jgi:hypothetical protein
MRRRMALVMNGSDKGRKWAHVFEIVFKISRMIENEKIPQVKNMMQLCACEKCCVVSSKIRLSCVTLLNCTGFCCT